MYSVTWERRPFVYVISFVLFMLLVLQDFVFMMLVDRSFPLHELFLRDGPLLVRGDFVSERESGFLGDGALSLGLDIGPCLRSNVEVRGNSGRVLAACGSFGTLFPRFMTAYGRLLIPEGSQSLAAYGYWIILGHVPRSETAYGSCSIPEGLQVLAAYGHEIHLRLWQIIAAGNGDSEGGCLPPLGATSVDCTSSPEGCFIHWGKYHCLEPASFFLETFHRRDLDGGVRHFGHPAVMCFSGLLELGEVGRDLVPGRSLPVLKMLGIW